jgi:hypothetical protein
LNEEITIAKSQIRRLDAFLERLGINPRDYVLEISNPRLGSATTDESGDVVEAEVDPIPPF